MLRNIVIALSFFFLFHVSSAQAPDDKNSSLIIAKKYFNDKNYLLSYKHLIIYKTVNSENLEKPGNAEVLKKVNKSIDELESTLSENIRWYQIKTARGWSDKQLNDSLRNVQPVLNFDLLRFKP